MHFDRRNEARVPPADDAPGAGAAGVRSVRAALRVLEMLACSAGPVRVSELAQALGLSRPRVCRHLATLEAMGLARRSAGRGYTFGERLTRLAQHALRERTLAEVAAPALRALRDELQQTVTLSVPVAGGAVVLACFECARPGAVQVRAGTLLRYPHSPAARLAAALAGADGAAPDSPGALRAGARWRALGVDYESDPQGNGLGGVAAPVFAGSLLVAMVSVVAPTRLVRPQPARGLIEALRRSVAAIECALLP